LRLLGSQGLSLTESKDYAPLDDWKQLEGLAIDALASVQTISTTLFPEGQNRQRTEAETRFLLRQLIDEILDDLKELKPGRIAHAYGGMPNDDARLLDDSTSVAIEKLLALQLRLDGHGA